MMYSTVAHHAGSVESSPTECVVPPGYSDCARSLIARGFCVVEISPYLKDRFWRMVAGYPRIPQQVKDSFTSPERTDGFLPYGMEHARSTNRVDLCERFCYRQKYRLSHHQHLFSHSPWYEAAAQCEVVLSAIAERLLAAICTEFDIRDELTIRDSSYLQFCSYDMRYRREDREYLQDRHEDGNLITLVMASRDGLVLFPEGVPRTVCLADSEIVVFTGSLLTVLSDGRIPYMDHAVLNPAEDVPRSSLIYFAVPELKRTYNSFVEGKPLDLEPLANELHQGFGNRSFADPPISVAKLTATEPL